MKNNILLSIVIPTWNRVGFLKNMLNTVLPQAEKFKSEIEICISDNDSKDNTTEVVNSFKQKYPGIITYKKNEKNLQFDGNIIKVLEMAQGHFVWLFGDDDLMGDGALQEVIGFIKKCNKRETGLLLVKTDSYFIDKKTGKITVYDEGLEKDKPEIFKVNKKDIISMSLPEISFISALIINNDLLKEIFKEDARAVKGAVGNLHIHMTLIGLMFLKYPNINGFMLNKRALIHQEIYLYKSFIERKFKAHYELQKEMDSSLLFSNYINSTYASIITKREKKMRREFIIDMIVMRAFKNFNYVSFFGCLKLFFQKATFIDALLFSFVFLILFLIPPIILISFYKILLIVKYGKKWRLKWNIAKHISSFPAKAI